MNWSSCCVRNATYSISKRKCTTHCRFWIKSVAYIYIYLNGYKSNWQALWAYYVRVFGEIYRCVNFNINFLNIANETFRMFCLLSTGLREAGFERWPRVDPRRADQVIFHEFLVSWRGCCVCRWGGHLSSEMTPASGTVNWIFLPIKCGWWQCGRLPAFLWAPGG